MKPRFYLTLSLVLSAFILTFSSCNKEAIAPEDGAIQQSETTEFDFTDPGDGATHKRPPRTCPPPPDYSCSSNFFEDTMDELLGTNFGRHPNGILDALVNCPPIAHEACDRLCPTVTLEFGNHVNTDWVIDDWRVGVEPCGPNNDFTSQEQLDFVAFVKQFAHNKAPMCGNSPMKPININLLWDTSNHTWFYVGAKITYVAPCDRGDLMGG